MKITRLNYTAIISVVLIIAVQSCTKEYKKEFAVGFKVFDAVRPGPDYYRDSIRQKGRPVNLRTWYPITKTTNPPILYREYLELLDAEGIGQSISRFRRLINSFVEIDSVTLNERLSIFLSSSSKVYVNQPLPESKFPMVILLGGGPQYHLELAELLAQYGMVVFSIPRLGSGEGSGLPFNTKGAKLLTDDIKFAIETASQFPFVNNNKISVIGWSYEGVPMINASRDFEGIQSVISLDASIGYQYGRSIMLDSVYFEKTPLKFQVLHFTGPSMSYGKSFDVLKVMANHSEVRVWEIEGMSHPDFTSISSVLIPQHFMHSPVNENYSKLMIFILKSLDINTDFSHNLTSDSLFTKVILN